VRSLGADDVIDYKKTDVLAELKRLGRVFDVAIDHVGTPKNLYERSAEFLKKRGSYVQVAANPTFADTYPLLMKMIMSTLGGCLTPGFKFVTGRATRDDFNTFGRWVEEGRLKPVISETFKFEDVPEAYAKLREGRARGKIILHVATITAKNS
jgi:NADPH:quinone reductase-like Zn-dependent oxidoreductase